MMTQSVQQLNFNHLYYFHMVATEGSLSAAARRMGVTQPTVSEQIKQLERSLGTSLFERKRGGGLSLNEEGRRVLEHTQVMFRASERLLCELDGHADSSRRALQVGISSTITRTFAAQFFLPLFEMPAIAPRIRSGSHEVLFERLVALELDILLTDTLPHEPEELGLKTRVVHTPRLVAVASPEMAARIHAFPEDLASVPLLRFTQGARVRYETDRYLRERGVVPQIAGETDDVSLMAHAAAVGIGVAFVPSTVIRDQTEKGTLVEIAPVAEIEQRVYAVFAHRETPAQVLDAVESLVQPGVGAT